MFYKDEVVKMMTDLIDNMNRDLLRSMGAAGETAEQSLNEMRPELTRVNGLLYDMLKENGIIP